MAYWAAVGVDHYGIANATCEMPTARPWGGWHLHMYVREKDTEVQLAGAGNTRAGVRTTRGLDREVTIDRRAGTDRGSSVAVLRAQPMVSLPGLPQGAVLRANGAVAFGLAVLDAIAWCAACVIVGWTATDIAMVAVFVAMCAAGGVYRVRLTFAVLADLPYLLSRVAIAAAGVLLWQSLANNATGRQILLKAAFAIAFTLLCRGAGYGVVRRLRIRRIIGERAVILGAGQIGAQVAKLMRKYPEHGVEAVGFLDDDPLLDHDARPVPLLGGNLLLANVIRQFGISIVVVAFGSVPESTLVDVIRTCDRLKCEIFLVPRLFELYGSRHGVDHVRGFPLIRLRRAAFRSVSWRMKRAFDVVISGMALVVLSPLIGAVALAVRIEGGPGIIFRQTRVGHDNEQFQVLKFRSLRPADGNESATLWNIKHDDRVGRVGRFIRRTSLDEIPQLWNTLRGDMSLVGPRPERPYFVDSFSGALPRYVARHRVPVGITGWAQVHGLRGDTSIEERARFDNDYIENWSLWLDIRILLMTLASVLRGSGG